MFLLISLPAVLVPSQTSQLRILMEDVTNTLIGLHPAVSLSLSLSLSLSPPLLHRRGSRTSQEGGRSLRFLQNTQSGLH